MAIKGHAKKTQRSFNIGLLTLLISVPLITMAALLLAIDQTPSNIKTILFFAVGFPATLAALTTVLFYFLKYWFKFWYWWIPNWLTTYIGFRRWQAVGAYGLLNIFFGIVILSVLYSVVNSVIIVSFVISIVIMSLGGMGRVWYSYNRKINKKFVFLLRLGEGEKPTKQQSKWYAENSSGDIKKYLSYKRISTSNPELPELDSLEAQLFACMQSYASLQQGNDTEDTRLSRDLRASIMSQYINVSASNLRHIFLLSELNFTHIGKVPSLQNQSASINIYGIIIYANLSECLIDNKTEKTPKIRSIKTPFYVELTILGAQPYIHAIEIQESPIERSLIHDKITSFAKNADLLYVPRIAPALIPRVGLLASSGVIRKWSLASNFLTGHTEQHAYYLLSVQPYIRYHRDATYVISCTVIPKTHDRIIVSDKRSRLYEHAVLLPIQRVSTESSDFSARYGIFIGQESAVPSLEILNPEFMKVLLDLPYEISIEVVGKQIFVYLPLSHVEIADFEIALNIMINIHKELRL